MGRLSQFDGQDRRQGHDLGAGRRHWGGGIVISAKDLA
jgi:hypothetical protein